MKRRSFFGHLAAAIAAPFVARAAVAAPRFEKVDILHQFDAGFDPDRIARAFSADLRESEEHHAAIGAAPHRSKPPGGGGTSTPAGVA